MQQCYLIPKLVYLYTFCLENLTEINNLGNFYFKNYLVPFLTSTLFRTFPLLEWKAKYH